MGTNYYLRKEPCQHCGRSDAEKHIGKSSGGWHFALHVYPDEGINDLEDWKAIFKSGRIFDEYDREISDQEMIHQITDRKWDRSCDWSKEELDKNHAEIGLNGLVRSKKDGVHCVKHGHGTWDCIVGEFS